MTFSRLINKDETLADREKGYGESNGNEYLAICGQSNYRVFFVITTNVERA